MARPLEAELQQDWGGATARGGILCRALDVIGGFCRQKPLGAVGAAIILALRIMAAFAEAIAPYAYDEQIPGARLRPAARTCSAPTT